MSHSPSERTLWQILDINNTLMRFPTYLGHDEGEPFRELLGWIGQFLLRHRIEHRLFELSAGPVLAAHVGPHTGPQVMWITHADVLPPEQGAPCAPLISDGWVLGRGSADMKLNLATALHALLALAQLNTIGVELVVVVDEERALEDPSFRQYLQVRGGPAPAWAITLEPTGSMEGLQDGEFGVSVQSKGRAEIRYTATGPSAHAARAHLAAARDPLRRTDEFRVAARELVMPDAGNPYYDDNVTVAFTMASAGVAANKTAPSAEGIIDVRFPAPLSVDDVVAPFAKLAAEHGVTITAVSSRRPVAVDSDHSYVRSLADRLGGAPCFAQSGGSDLTELPPAVPCVECGNGEGHHGPGERAGLYGALRLRRALISNALDVLALATDVPAQPTLTA